MYKVYYMKWNEMEFAPQKRVVFNIPISFGPENSSGEGVEGPSVGSPLTSTYAEVQTISLNLFVIRRELNSFLQTF